MIDRFQTGSERDEMNLSIKNSFHRKQVHFKVFRPLMFFYTWALSYTAPPVCTPLRSRWPERVTDVIT